MPHTCHRPTVPASRTSSVTRRVGALAVTLLVAVLGLAGAAVLDASPAAAATSCSGPLGGGQIRVVIVVDPGETGPRAPRATCLVVASGTSGSKILAQRASELGLPSPRYAGSGLLCGLDGFPATECPVNNGGTYAYWSYFNGAGGSWSYGHDNPFVRRMGDGEIMGWRYTTGSADGQAPMPRIAPSSSLFPAVAPPVTAPPATAPSGGGGATAGSGGSGAGGAAPAGDGAVVAVPDLSGLADASSTTTSLDTTASSVVAGDAVDQTDDPAASTDEELAAAPASSSSSDAGRWVGLAVVIAAVGALVVGAVVRTRARSGP